MVDIVIDMLVGSGAYLLDVPLGGSQYFQSRICRFSEV